MIKNRVLIKKTIAPSDLDIQTVPCSLQWMGLEKDIQGIWQRLQEQSAQNGTELWDGTYYRLENILEVAAGSDLLKISTLQYSTVRSLIEYSSKGTLDPALHPYHINTGSFIRTKDDRYIIGVKKRANGSTFFDLVGGGLQSSELQVTKGQNIAENMYKEIHEELNLHQSSLSECKIIGYLLASNMSVIIIFQSLTDLSFADVKNLFAERREHEFHDIIGVPSNAISRFLLEGPGYFPALDQLLTQ